MKAKDLTSLLILVLGIMGGCKKSFETKYDFIAFREKGGYHIYPTGTNPNVIGIGYDFDSDGEIESLYVQATGEGLTKDKMGIGPFWSRWTTAFRRARVEGRVQYVEQTK